MMQPGTMIANFNPTIPPEYAEIWQSLGCVFLVFIVFEILRWSIGGYIVLSFTDKRKLIDQIREIQGEKEELVTKVRACELRIEYLENDNTTLRQKSMRSGSRIIQDMPYEEMSDIDQWRERQRWKEHPRSTDDEEFEFDYDIETK